MATPSTRSRTGRVLVLAAWAPELTALQAALAGDRPLSRRVPSGVVGVGLVEAAIGASRTIEKVRPGAVVFVGTAGRYRPVVPIGAAVVARRIRLASSSVARGEGYLPDILPAAMETDLALRRALARHAPLADVACPLAITKRAALARRLAADTGCTVETLEAFAVARAAAAHDLPFAAVLGISNDVGPAAHAQWRTHAATAAASACQVVLKWLRG
jgi:nucleoside phosphorylase